MSAPVTTPVDEPPTVGVVPTSMGALTAEEWMIQPYSPLPSFLEMIWMQEAEASMCQALRLGVEYARNRFERQDTREQANQDDGDRKWRNLVQTLERWKQQGVRLAKRVLQDYPHELVALVMYGVERHSLRRTRATLAESMYGGHRVQRQRPNPTSRQQQTAALEPLTPTAMTRLALCKALVPYLQSKLDELWTQLCRTRGSTAWSQVTPIRTTLVFLYPYLRASLQGANWLCHWRFLMGQSFHFDLVSLLLGHIVRRVTVQDHNNKLPNQQHTVKSRTDEQQQIDKTTTMETVQGYLSRGLLLAILLSGATWMRAEWDRTWRQEQLKSSTPIPPPPPLAKQPKKECGLCHTSPQQSPTASSSGFVFCWHCIQPYVARHATCPVTGKPCRDDQLVRLYEPHVTETTGG